MKIQKGIRKAIEGDFITKLNRKNRRYLQSPKDWIKKSELESIQKSLVNGDKRAESLLLDPEFWRALGKTEDWEKKDYGEYSSEAEFRHHDFLINLWEGEKLEKAFDLATS